MTVVELKPAAPRAAAPPPALSPARARLEQVIAAHDAAREDLGAAQQPLDRLAAAVRVWEDARRELAALREKDEGILANWLSEGAAGPRPLPSEETLAAERRAANRLQEGEAARKALPQAQAAFARCAEIARGLHKDRDVAIYAAAVEAAHEFAPKAEAASAEPSAEAGNAAAQIRTLVTTIKRVAGVPFDRESGPRLLEALTTEPTAGL